MDTTVRGSVRLLSASCERPGTWSPRSAITRRRSGCSLGSLTGRPHLYTPLLGAKFASMTTSPRTGRFSAQRRFDYRRLVSVFDVFVNTGQVDLSVRKRGGGGPQPTSEEFTALVCRVGSRHGRPWSGAGDTRCLWPGRARLSRVLESRGVCSLDTADGASVLAFVESLSPRWASSSLFWVLSNFRPLFTFIGRTDLVDAVDLAGVRRSHRVLPVLGDDDERLVLGVRVRSLSARDAAITLLALTTGLRACDIIGLRLADIDWRGQVIAIVQQKTSNPLTVPLTGLVVARLVDYVLGDRPPRRRSRVLAHGGTAHSTGRSRLDIPGDFGGVPQGGRHRCEGRDPPSTA